MGDLNDTKIITDTLSHGLDPNFVYLCELRINQGLFALNLESNVPTTLMGLVELDRNKFIPLTFKTFYLSGFETIRLTNVSYNPGTSDLDVYLIIQQWPYMKLEKGEIRPLQFFENNVVIVDTSNGSLLVDVKSFNGQTVNLSPIQKNLVVTVGGDTNNALAGVDNVKKSLNTSTL